jgi:hypothetical protein
MCTSRMDIPIGDEAFGQCGRQIWDGRTDLHRLEQNAWLS